MADYVFKLPDVGEGTAEAEIAAWHVRVGDRVAEDQKLVDVLTDKAVVEMTSPVSGIVVSLSGEVGAKAAVGSPLAILRTDEIAPETTAEAAPMEVAGTALAVHLLDMGATPLKPPASPAVRRRARELGIGLEAVRGSGPSGRITQDDLQAHVAGKVETSPLISVSSPKAADSGVEEVKIIGLRRKIAERMQEAKRRIPHITYVEELDLTELEDLRQHLNERREREKPKLTLLPFFIRALVCALPQFRQINARYDDNAGVLHRYTAVHIGIATQTTNGLMVPVLRNAQDRDLWSCAREVGRLALAAREGKATRDELSGSTITLTSLGTLGGVVSTPVINHPEVAIVGPNKVVERPVVRNSQMMIRKMMNLSSSFDHRIVDGHDAARFVQRVKELLECPALLFIDKN